MPKSGDKVVRTRKTHSVARGAIGLVEALEAEPWVEAVGNGRMRCNDCNSRRDLEIKVKWYDSSTRTYKVVVSVRDYDQDLFVRVAPGNNGLFAEHLSQYKQS